MASWRVHRGVEWCLYGPQTPRETRDTRIFRTTLHVLGPVNRAKAGPGAPSGSRTANNKKKKKGRCFLKKGKKLKGGGGVASRGLAKAQPAAAAVPEPKNRYFTRFSRSPPASSGCGQLIRHKSACGRSGDQGSQGEPPRSLGGLYAAVGAPAQSYRGSTIIPWPLPPPLALSTIFRRFSADVAVLPASSPFRVSATPAFPLIQRRPSSKFLQGFHARFSVARLWCRHGAA